MTDIVKDVQYAIQSHQPIKDLVSSGVIGSDPAWLHGWVFDSDLKTVLENTEKVAIVVSYAGGWSVPPDGNMVRFPAVLVDIWADPTRNADKSVKVDDAKSKCFQVYDALFPLLHRVNRDTDAGGSIYFNGTRIISSESLGEPELSKVADGNGARMLRCRFGISY